VADADKKHNPPNSVMWTKKYIWNNKGDGAALYDSAGELLSYTIEFPGHNPKRKLTPPQRTTV